MHSPPSPPSQSTGTIVTPPTTPGSTDKHTPYSKSKNSSGRCATGSLKVDETYHRLALEFPRWGLGPMPVHQWLQEFLPLSAELLAQMPPPAAGLFQDIPLEPAIESDLYHPMITSLNGLTTKFKFVPTDRTSKQGNKAGSSKPDITLYLNGLEAHYTQQTDSHGTFAHFGAMELFIKVKKTRSDDCFRDDSDEFIAFDFNKPLRDLSDLAQQRRRTLGQNVYYATQLLARQHRHFAFSLTMSGTFVRFIRWDRAGAIVSAAFDCHEEPGLLCQFLWRLDHLEAERRGYDTTVKQATDGEHVAAFASAVRDRLCFELGIRDDQPEEANKVLERHYDPEHISLVSIPARGALKQYYISKPVDMPRSVACRGTRGYWAIDANSLEVRFLKDTWRKDVPGTEHEGDISQELSSRGVRNVPEIDCHNDVLSGPMSTPQRTITQDFINKPWVKRSLSISKLRERIVQYFHYRMVSKTVGCSLSEHKDMKELLSAARDIYDAVIDAYEKCGRLHRDISANNVILVRDPQTSNRSAYLIDWEFSVTAAKLKLRSHMISGTWQFIACRLLRRKDQSPHNLDDDLESIFWVVYWFLLVCYSKFAVERLALVLSSTFDAFPEDGGMTLGGERKKALLLDPNDLLDGLELHPYLKQWLFRYSVYLASGLTELYRYNPMEPRLTVMDLRRTVFDLVDDIPDNIARSDPDWENLHWYRRPALGESLPATFSADSICELVSNPNVSYATMPAPSITGHAPVETLAVGIGNADTTESPDSTTVEYVEQGSSDLGGDLGVDGETEVKERGPAKRARME